MSVSYLRQERVSWGHASEWIRRRKGADRKRKPKPCAQEQERFYFDGHQCPSVVIVWMDFPAQYRTWRRTCAWPSWVKCKTGVKTLFKPNHTHTHIIHIYAQKEKNLAEGKPILYVVNHRFQLAYVPCPVTVVFVLSSALGYSRDAVMNTREKGKKHSCTNRILTAEVR